MITADKLKELMELDRYGLVDLLANSGYKDMKLDAVKFLGLTNAGLLCYKVDYFDEHTGEDDVGKVFVGMSEGRLVADF